MKLMFSVGAILAAAPLYAATPKIVYASPDGTSSGAGTQASPYDIETALNSVSHYNNDEVCLLPGTYKCATVKLDQNWSGVTVKGLGETPAETVLDYEGTQHKLTVGASSFLGNVTISNFTGSAASLPVVFIAGDATVSNVVVCCGNLTSSPAIQISGPNVRVVDSVVRDVSSGYAYGAAMSVWKDDSVLCRTTFANNSLASSGAGGGAVHYMLSRGTIDSCVFTNNTANTHGGAVYYARETVGMGLLVTNTLFVRNSSTAGQGGGAICCTGSAGVTNRIVDCRFEENKTVGQVSGAGIKAQGGGVTEIVDSTFKKNSSAYFGGALATDGTVEAVVRDCSFEANEAARKGGAVLLASTGRPCLVSNCTFRANVATGASESYGGAISSDGPSAGAIRLVACDSLFEDNLATSAGGAIGPDYSGASLFGFVGACTNCVFRRNCARIGGAVAAPGGSFAGCTFEENLASNRFDTAFAACKGGAFCANARGTVTHPDATNGYVFAGCSFTRNRALGQFGSALYLARAQTVHQCQNATLTDCTFAGNVVGSVGNWSGALSVDNTIARLDIDRCRFEANTSPGSGAALGINALNDTLETVSTIRNSLFLANSNTYYWAAAASVGKKTRFENCSFIGNRCDQRADAQYKGQCAGVWMHGEDADSAIVNCLFYDNRDSNWERSQVNDVYPATARDTLVSYSYSNYDFFKSELHNVFAADPAFVDAKAGDYRPRRRSRCVNAGLDDLSWMANARDLQNLPKVPRIIGGRVDIGCYEFCPSPAVILIIR